MSLWTPRSQATTLEELKSEWSACKACPFYPQRKNVVMGDGPIGAVIFAVGQYPGAKEDLEGTPFIGPGGHITKVQFDKIGVPGTQIFWTNVLACMPFRHHQQVRVAWMKNCWSRVDAELSIVKPKMIVPMGTPAARRFIQKLPPKGETRGKRFVYRGVPGITIMHPAALLRDQKVLRKRPVEADVAEDFENIKDLYTEVTSGSTQSMEDPDLR